MIRFVLINWVQNYETNIIPASKNRPINPAKIPKTKSKNLPTLFTVLIINVLNKHFYEIVFSKKIK